MTPPLNTVAMSRNHQEVFELEPTYLDLISILTSFFVTNI